MKRTITQSIMQILPTLIGLGLLALFVWLVWQWYFENTSLLAQKSDKGLQHIKFDQGEAQQADSPTFSAVPLFGDQVKTKKKAKKTVVKKEELKIKLVGTLLAGKPVALIESEGQSNAYAVNDKIGENIKLLKIGVNTVTVDHAGKQHKVKMDEGDWANNVGVSSSVSPKTASLPNSSLPEPTNTTTVVPDNSRSSDELTLAVPIALNQVFTSTPVQDNGEMVGFRVKPNKNGQYRQLFDVLKLQEGDLISQVNGISVIGYQSLNDLNVLLMNGSSVELTVKRMGEKKTLKVQVP